MTDGNVPSGTMAKLRAKAQEFRDIEAEIASIEELLASKKRAAYAIEHEELPELMMEAGVDKIGIPAEGNMPAFEMKLSAFYAANIAAAWEPERRTAAFKYLEDKGAADLIKTEITIRLPREKRGEAMKLIKQLKDYAPVVKESVHTATLTSWLKERSQAGDQINTEIIGGTVGSVVKMKARKETA